MALIQKVSEVVNHVLFHFILTPSPSNGYDQNSDCKPQNHKALLSESQAATVNVMAQFPAGYHHQWKRGG